jgi:ATP-dependent helicase/nuclease subunit A
MTAAEAIRETTEAQRLAASPSLSAFVPANAGAGKTRVLTNRVARLLLEGAAPPSILCITFTKAAAAEMADRLFKLLGGFALADDAKLAAALQDLDGDKTRARSKAELAEARRLFARALETPGGLKIQTIHSFCESVLKRFPLEAGVAPGFSVIDALEAARRAKDAVARVASSAGEDAAFAHLLTRMNGADLRDLLETAAIARRRDFAIGPEGWGALSNGAREALGVAAGETAGGLRLEILEEFDPSDVDWAAGALEKSGPAPASAAKHLRRHLAAADVAARFDALLAFFTTQAGTPRKQLATQATDRIDPNVRPYLISAQEDFCARLQRLRAAQAFEDTHALYGLLERVFAAYSAAKTARAALDFDDLIVLTRRLLTGAQSAAWVLYKLDHGLDHILLDEAQDTGPDAWDVIERPLAEFFAGTGARALARTFFAVGDKKQSIYSFQGADAKLFDAKEQDLGKKIAAAAAYENVPLKASFRTTAPVLQFVDALFARREVWEGVSDTQPEHLCTRDGMAGSVEIWPLVPREPGAPAEAWDAPFDQTSATNPKRVLAEGVAETIAGWLSGGEILASQGRPVAAGDIMILVQKRDALFHEMIRALGRRAVPVAGADRMKLVEDQGVLDLLSYARAALYEGDDLSLAETLKSPFFNVSDDRLFDLAHAREGRLWRALIERDEWRAAADEIALARAVALKDGPAAFFMHILETGAPSGWRRIAARLGAPSREPIEEFLRLALDFETSHPRSLRRFLDAVAASGAEANRDSAEAGDSVRVMTAHKAKGLEAPIVFILDAHAPPNTGGKETLRIAQGPDGARVPLLALDQGKLAPAAVAAIEEKKCAAWDEYRRLLYVAATRAKDRLYICGHQRGGRKYPEASEPHERTWHALALDAMGPETEIDEERFGGKVRRIACPQTVPPKLERDGAAAFIAASLPDYLMTPAAAETRPRRLSPSALAPAEEDASYAPGRREDAFLRGRILHRLLELLPEIAPGARPDAALRLARRMGAGLAEDRIAALVAEAMRVLDDPLFAPVFAPGGLAEAAIGGAPQQLKAGLSFSGQIDRLVILKDRILIVDYKTNRPPPARVEDVAPGYLAQLAAYRALLQEIYPRHQIEAALLWTYDARLMPIPAAALDKAHVLTLA